MEILTLVAFVLLRPAPLIGLLTALTTFLGAIVGQIKLVTGRSNHD